jgi:hypothetical protein
MISASNPALQYYIHDDSDTLRLELAGNLSGADAQNVYQAWHTALSIIGARPLIIDISYVVAADEQGRALLRLWQQNGAQIIAGSPQSMAVVEPIFGERLLAPPPKPTWLERLNRFLHGRSPVIVP